MRLVLEDVHTYYGQSHIIQGISLTVREGEVVALLGRNGAGKTTTMRTVTGLTRLRRGRVLLDGTDISRLAPHRIARRRGGVRAERKAVLRHADRPAEPRARPARCP